MDQTFIPQSPFNLDNETIHIQLIADIHGQIVVLHIPAERGIDIDHNITIRTIPKGESPSEKGFHIGPTNLSGQMCDSGAILERE